MQAEMPSRHQGPGSEGPVGPLVLRSRGRASGEGNSERQLRPLTCPGERGAEGEGGKDQARSQGP